jgi:hypothetical protein
MVNESNRHLASNSGVSFSAVPDRSAMQSESNALNEERIRPLDAMRAK